MENLDSKSKHVFSLERIFTDARDKLLAKAAANGEKRAFESLMSIHKKRIIALGMSFFKNELDAEDFAQDVFLKVYRSLQTFRGESSFSTWITRIAYNLAITSVRRRKDYLPLSNEESIPSANTTPEEDEIREITKKTVRKAVQDLPERYALCIELYFFYDNSYDEICKITGENLNTVKSHIFRAKTILRENLREIYES